MKPLTPIEIAYLAGLTDGEGCIAVLRERNRNCRGGLAYRSRFSISNTNCEVMEWLARTVGVGCVKSHQPKMRNSKRQWTWELWSDNAAALVECLQPHLIIRREQARLFLAFHAGLKKRSGPHLSDEEIAFREDCYHQSRALNQRGAKQYGGGGHRNASGFRLSYEAAKEFELLP